MSSARQAVIGTDARGQTDIAALFDQGRPGLELFFDFPLASGDYKLGLTSLMQPSCRDPYFDLSVVSTTGGKPKHAAFTPSSSPGPQFQFFTVSPGSSGAAFLQLRLKVEPQEPCAGMLKQVTVERL